MYDIFIVLGDWAWVALDIAQRRHVDNQYAWKATSLNLLKIYKDKNTKKYTKKIQQKLIKIRLLNYRLNLSK